MNLQQLMYFDKIARTGQYTHAAKELHVTQAALSYAVSNLEKELGTRLFERGSKGLRLTAAGEAYLSCVRDALQALERGERQVREIESHARSVIRIDSLESVRHLVLSMISTLYSDTPEHFSFEMSNSLAADIEQRILRRETDIAFSTHPASKGIACRLVGYQDNVVAVKSNDPLADRDSVSLRELQGRRFIAYTRDCLIRPYYDSIFHNLGVKAEIFAESRMHSNILDMVSYGMGAAIVPRMQHIEERYDIHILNIEDDIPPRAIYLLWAEDAMRTKELQTFLYSLEGVDLSCYL